MLKKLRRNRFLVILLTMVLTTSVFGTHVSVYATETQEQNSEVIEDTQEVEEKKSVLSELTSAKNLNSKGYDIVYVIDNSNSVGKQQKVRNQAFRNITNLAVGLDARIGVVYFADHVDEQNTLALTSVKNAKGVDSVLESLILEGTDLSNKDTNIGTGLKKAADFFDGQSEYRERIVVLFSDGINERIDEHNNYDMEYKKNADKYTKEQVKELKEMGVDIYCVYFGKDYSDKDYLKEIVNYFPETEKVSDYSKDRFFEVAKEDVNQLSKQFIDVFYKMQDNMKRREIGLDSKGNYSFYIPSLGIEKLVVYLDDLDGKIESTSVKYENKDFEYEEVKNDYDTARFITCDNPKSGHWMIEVETDSNDDKKTITGTTAYYTNLQAEIELIFASETESDLARDYQVLVRFYNKEGEPIAIDEDAKVEVNFWLDESEGNVPLSMNMENGVAKSDLFHFADYGMYHCDVSLTYGDGDNKFVDLQYTIEDIVEIHKTTPITHSISGREFKGEKTEEGIVFSIKEDILFEDLEGETITVTEVVQLNAANNVDVKQENGYIRVVAQKASDVEFALKITDASGMDGEVTIEGSVTNQGTARMMEKIVIIIILLIIVAFILAQVNKKRKQKAEKDRLLQEKRNKELAEEARKKEEKERQEEEERKQNELKNKLAKFWEICEEFKETFDSCKDELKQMESLREGFEADLFEDKDVFRKELTLEQCNDFGITKYLQDDFIDEMFDDLDKEEDRLNGMKDEIAKLFNVVKKAVTTEQWNTFMESLSTKEKHQSDMFDMQKDGETSNKNLDDILAKVGKLIEEAERQKRTLNMRKNVLEERKEKMTKEEEWLSDKVYELSMMLQTEIPCTLILENISEIPTAFGHKNHLNVKGENIPGYYKLDDVNILRHGKLKDNIAGETGIYVYGYEDMTGKERGLCLKSHTTEFAYKNAVDGNLVQTRELVVKHGEQCDIEIKLARRTLRMTVIVD